MFTLLKDTCKSIINDDYDDLAYTLIIFSIISIVVLGAITGVSYFAKTPEHIGALANIAGPGNKIWLIGFITIIVSIIFGIFTLFADSKYEVDDDKRFLVIGYFWVFSICSGSVAVIFPIIFVYFLIKYLFYIINFCLEHFFMLFAPRKTKEKMIVREKTEKEMISTYNNFFKN